ncbi:hypothetical protein PV08_03974 [Exophiala spinifera]|uniref:Zn(2)-C6 fungal-type domain-containing protein n=1 Tax=Exophiala spinifera TaxID=91928 RepID=A0A0D2BZK9_9EURO|nr:uncharacterized protein PV08_03974 [Exophiala spinifera]KIW16784.1 hypothetical protein PV08_03974 [Exophiala spinifera]
MTDPGAAPACTKCRSHRVKCDRQRPTCSRCLRIGHDCHYPVRNPARAYMNYVLDLEAEVARLEQELRAAESGGYSTSSIISPKRDAGETFPARAQDGDAIHQPEATGPTDDPVLMELLMGNASPLSAHSDSLIENLFSSTDTNEKDSVQSLVDDIRDASLSAMVVPETTSSQDFYLRPLILSATLPVNTTSPKLLPKPLHLPQKGIAEKVFSKYRHSVLPDLPFMSEYAAHDHLQATYQPEPPPYSIFITALMLATTAVHISPGSVIQASSLQRTAIVHLEMAFASAAHPQPLRDLEALVGLAYYAALVGDDYSDPWALSGIAMRVCVDLGLHKFAETDQKRRLFWSAFALDRKIAVARSLPFGIPDKSISAELPLSTSRPFKLYMILSELSCMQKNPNPDRCREIRVELAECVHGYRQQQQLTHHLERDIALTTRLLARLTTGDFLS